MEGSITMIHENGMNPRASKIADIAAERKARLVPTNAQVLAAHQASHELYCKLYESLNSGPTLTDEQRICPEPDDHEREVIFTMLTAALRA
jgi:hypothetical protein